MSRPPIQLVERAQRDSLGHRILNRVMAVLLVALIFAIAFKVI